MKAIEGVLKEELERLLELEKSYAREIRELPKGSIQHKRIKGKSYPYLVFRKGSDVIYEYIGNLSGPELKKFESDIDQRRKFESLLKEVRKNISRLDLIVHGRKRAA